MVQFDDMQSSVAARRSAFPQMHVLLVKVRHSEAGMVTRRQLNW